MQTRLQGIPTYLISLVDSLRAQLRDPLFCARHRVRPQDFTRHRQLTFPILMLFLLQQTVKSLQRHLHEFLEDLAQGQLFEPLTSGTVTHARAKLKDSAFLELNRDGVLPLAYGPEHPIGRWHGHRLFGVDSSLLRLPDSDELGRVFGWKEASHQNGATGTRFPEARLSVLYDLLNRLGHDTRLEPSTVGEVALARQQVAHWQPGDVAINDRGFSGYLYFATVGQRGAHFIGRCSTGSLAAAQEMFRRDRSHRSQVVWLFAPPEQKAECQRLGLPLKMKGRFVRVRLPTGELEVLATSLREEALYPTGEFLTVYHGRWGHETFYLMLKGRLELENFSGQTEEAVRQDVPAAVFLANLERVLSEPAPAVLDEPSPTRRQPRQVNRANAYHAVKDRVLDLLYRDEPVAAVVRQWMKLMLGRPVAVRPKRQGSGRGRVSFHRSYHYQRRVKKVVF